LSVLSSDKRKEACTKKLKNLVNVQASLWYTCSVRERGGSDMILITGGSFQGKTEFAVMRFPERERIVHFEEQVRDWIREGLDPICQTERLVKEHPDSVVVIDEIGSGIVPMNQEERIWREAVGRAGCKIAESAVEVYRVMSGIGIRIK